mgnify:FL=1
MAMVACVLVFFATGFFPCAEMVSNPIARQRTKMMFLFTVTDLFMVKILKLRYKYTSAIENQRNNIWTIIRQSNKFSCQSVNYLPVVLNTAKKNYSSSSSSSSSLSTAGRSITGRGLSITALKEIIVSLLDSPNGCSLSWMILRR